MLTADWIAITHVAFKPSVRNMCSTCEPHAVSPWARFQLQFTDGWRYAVCDGWMCMSIESIEVEEANSLRSRRRCQHWVSIETNSDSHVRFGFPGVVLGSISLPRHEV